MSNMNCGSLFESVQDPPDKQRIRRQNVANSLHMVPEVGNDLEANWDLSSRLSSGDRS